MSITMLYESSYDAVYGAPYNNLIYYLEETWVYELNTTLVYKYLTILIELRGNG